MTILDIVREKLTEALSNKTRHLDIAGVDITTEEIPALVELLEANPTITSLNVSYNAIGDEGLKQIASLKNIVSLGATNTNMGDKGFQAICTMPDLLSLDVSRNHISDEGFQGVKALQNLMDLNGWGNNIKNIDVLSNLPNLLLLDLDFNKVAKEDVQRVQAEMAKTIDEREITNIRNHINEKILKAPEIAAYHARPTSYVARTQPNQSPWASTHTASANFTELPIDEVGPPSMAR